MLQFHKKLYTKILRNFINSIGWQTRRKIVVFESDDWGSIRMPSRDSYNFLVRKNIVDSHHPYVKYDSLASEEDIQKLADLLSHFTDINHNHPIFTTNFITANPDFLKIRENDFAEYYYLDYRQTISQYPNHSRSFNLVKKAITERLFYPQFHGREHINVNRWIGYLSNGDVNAKEAFLQNTFLFKPEKEKYFGKTILASADYDSKTHSEITEQISKDGLRLFHTLFDFHSCSYVAPNYIWGPTLEKLLSNSGVKFIQGTKVQNIPKINSGKYQRKLRFTGMKSDAGLIHIVRNCFFEPSSLTPQKSVDSCLNQISNSFLWNKPAVISSHRLNYVGFIDPDNRDFNLLLLQELLTKILKQWPDVEFLTTPELGELISNER